MTRAERQLLVHRLEEMLEHHEKAEEADKEAKGARALAIADAREDVVNSALLREVIQELRA